MKHILRALVLVGVVLALSSCLVIFGFVRGDKIVVDGDEYDLAELVVEYYGLYDGGAHDVTLVIVSEDIDYSASSLSGDGELVVIFLASPDDELVEGVYDHTSSSMPDDFEFTGGLVLVGIDSATESIDEVYAIVDGSVEVKKLINDDYIIQGEIEVEDIDSNNYEAKLFFQGPVEDEIDYTLSVAPNRLESLGLPAW
jgi:hypothetical protein